jgi:hypothetical protein
MCPSLAGRGCPLGHPEADISPTDVAELDLSVRAIRDEMLEREKPASIEDLWS